MVKITTLVISFFVGGLLDLYPAMTILTHSEGAGNNKSTAGEESVLVYTFIVDLTLRVFYAGEKSINLIICHLLSYTHTHHT